MLTLFRNLLFLSLLFILSLPLTAHAKWVVFQGEVKIAVLVDIEEGDEKLPEVDRYIICSPGGNFATTRLVAVALQDKVVYYDLALSGGAYIANATNALPVFEDSVKGYHWSRYKPNSDLELSNAVVPRVLASIDQEILQNIVKKYRPRFAARIIGMMDGLGETEFVVDVASAPNPEVLGDNALRNLTAFKRYKEMTK